MTTQGRVERLLPNGIPHSIRIYDHGGTTIDRYTVVYTRMHDGYCHYVGMRSHLSHPQGVAQHGAHAAMIDRPSCRHLGTKIAFDELLTDCQRLVLSAYKDSWNIRRVAMRTPYVKNQDLAFGWCRECDRQIDDSPLRNPSWHVSKRIAMYTKHTGHYIDRISHDEVWHSQQRPATTESVWTTSAPLPMCVPAAAILPLAAQGALSLG